jgi:hypothetical protein
MDGYYWWYQVGYIYLIVFTTWLYLIYYLNVFKSVFRSSVTFFVTPSVYSLPTNTPKGRQAGPRSIRRADLCWFFYPQGYCLSSQFYSCVQLADAIDR